MARSAGSPLGHCRVAAGYHKANAAQRQPRPSVPISDCEQLCRSWPKNSDCLPQPRTTIFYAVFHAFLLLTIIKSLQRKAHYARRCAMHAHRVLCTLAANVNQLLFHLVMLWAAHLLICWSPSPADGSSIKV